MQHQEHFGRKFYQDNKIGYWISTDYPRIRAHQWIWIKNHGNIPKGYHIHHKNENKSDNRIENLELIEKSRHHRHHMNDPIRKQQAKERADKYRPLTKAWHKSEEGRLWHKAHGIFTWINRKLMKITCKQCSQMCETKTYHQEFCSNKCKSKWRRDKKVDNIDKECPVCKKIFSVSKYSKTKTCSRNCGKKI